MLVATTYPKRMHLSSDISLASLGQSPGYNTAHLSREFVIYHSPGTVAVILGCAEIFADGNVASAFKALLKNASATSFVSGLGYRHLVKGTRRNCSNYAICVYAP
jgi:hypothetical protein